MQRWEYRSLKRVYDVFANEWIWEEGFSGRVIDQLGLQSWELVTVVARRARPNQYPAGVIEEEEWIFKRPLQS